MLQRVQDSPYFRLERPATPAQIEVGAAAWRAWLGIPMPEVYRELLRITNGLNVNGLYLFAAFEYTAVEDGAERWMPGIDAENAGYLYGIADTSRGGSSARPTVTCTHTTPKNGCWLVVDHVNWSGDPLLEFASCEDLSIDRIFCYLDDSADYPDA